MNQHQQYIQCSKEVRSSVKTQVAELLKRGYKRKDLWVSSAGVVLVDQDAGELEAHNAVFHPEATQHTRV